MWKTPRHKPFEPTGITRGATVAGQGLAPTASRTRHLIGQVWAQAPSTYKKRWWWVVTNSGIAFLCEEGDLTVLGQCVTDTTIPIPNTAA